MVGSTGPDSSPDVILDVDGLTVSFAIDRAGRGQGVRAVDDVSFSLRRGRSLALMGETGCGKTSTALALMGLVPAPGRMDARTIVLHTESGAIDISDLDPTGEQMRRLRGREMAMVFQDTAASLSPVRTVGAQLRETIRLHRPQHRCDATREAVSLLDRVGMPDARRWLNAYAHELSGGMSQRVGIALALAGKPRVLIADEPTTALDADRQDEIVALIRDLQAERGLAVVFITHDLSLVRDAADEVAVMYLGRFVETAPVDALLDEPRHPYTAQLLGSLPSLHTRRRRLPTVSGTVPSPTDDLHGCSFAARCHSVESRCREAVPRLAEAAPHHRVRCVLDSSLGGAVPSG